MRLERGARLMRETDLQVQEVAHAFGYEDTRYFSRHFRQAHGLSPTASLTGYAKDATQMGENSD